MGRKRSKSKGFIRSAKEWEESIAGHIGKFLDKVSVDDLINASTFLGLNFMYALWEKDERPWIDVLTLSVPQAGVDYLLLKSGTEVGVGTAIGHIAARGLLELLGGWRTSWGIPQPRWMDPFNPAGAVT